MNISQDSDNLIHQLHKAISTPQMNFRTEQTAVKVGDFVDISADLSPGKWLTAVSHLGGISTVSAKYV
jgi:hypothetical protein